MKKEEVKNLILKNILGNKVGVNVLLSPKTLETNSIIRNWREEIKLETNEPLDKFWFAFIDHIPDANFEHPVEYVFINDETGEHKTIRGTSPPDNLDDLEKIQ